MRCTQLIGLTEEAERFLDEHVKREPRHTCPTCNHTTGGGMAMRVYDDSGSSGMFGDGPDLHEYTLKEDGQKVREVVQAAPWSSGPCIFLCLETEDGDWIKKWSEEDMLDA